MSPHIVTKAKPYPRDCSPQQRREMCAWLAEQGIPNRSVESVELDVIDLPLVRVTRFVCNEDGHALLDPDRPKHPLRETTEHVQTLCPPWWWQPVATPSS